MILGFAHPCLVVSDVDAARAFYEKMFGFRLLSDEGWSNAPGVDIAIGSKNSACRGYMLEGHNCHLEMFEFTAPQQTGPDPSSLGPHEQGIRHLAFYVDDCRAEYKRLLSLGGNMLGEPVDIARAIRREVHSKTGLTCSIGVSACRPPRQAGKPPIRISMSSSRMRARE